MRQEKQIRLTSKFPKKHYWKTLEVPEALAALRSEEGDYYNLAERTEDGMVRLRKTVVGCPYCGTAHRLKNRKGITREQWNALEEWEDAQMFLFEREATDKLLLFFTEGKTLTCPYCGETSDIYGKSVDVSVIREKTKVILRCAAKGWYDILALPDLPVEELTLDFPVYEQIEFNFRKGHSCLRKVTGTGKILFTLDGTTQPQNLGVTELAGWFQKSELLRKEAVQAFEEVTKKKIPFEPEEIRMEHLVLFTKFTGYDRAFYDAVPCNKETGAVDKSFVHQEKLHTCETAMEYLQTFPFARYKSVRKQMFEAPGLLFYLPECNTLFELLQDVNVFREMLAKPCIFDALLYLHKYPLTVQFFRDYCLKKGAVGLCRRMFCENEFPEELKQYILYYSALNAYERSQEQKKWYGKWNELEEIRQNRVSVPTQKEEENGLDAVIDGFAFRVLRNTAEYYEVGNVLDNCLKSWEAPGSVVLAVCQARKVVAAVEIRDKKRIQARAYKNQSIDTVTGLPEALEKWELQKGLSVGEEW